MLVSGLGRISGGFIIFRISPYAVAHGSILALCALFGGLAVIPEPAIVLGLALLGAWFGSVIFGALFQLANRSAPADSLGVLLGFINFLANLGAVAFTLLFGWSKDSLGSFTWGFAILCPLAAAALALGWRGLRGGSPRDAMPSADEKSFLIHPIIVSFLNYAIQPSRSGVTFQWHSLYYKPLVSACYYSPIQLLL